MKAIAYCRVSTVAQGEDGISLEMQRDRIAAWCTGNGYEQEAVFVETMSGGRASNRPELQKALSLACKVRGVLVVFSLSRLARSVKDTLLIAERLERPGPISHPYLSESTPTRHWEKWCSACYRL